MFGRLITASRADRPCRVILNVDALAHHAFHCRAHREYGLGAVACAPPGRGGQRPPRSRARAFCGPHLRGRSPQGRRLYDRQSQVRPRWHRAQRGAHASPDRGRRHCERRWPLARHGVGSALSRRGGDRDRRLRGGRGQSATVPVADVPARSALRIQPHHADALSGRSRQRAAARSAARRPAAACDAHADGTRWSLVVGVGLVCLARSDAADDVGLAGLHRAAVQSVLAARGPPAQGPDRGAAGALRLQLERRVRRGRLAPLEARQTPTSPASVGTSASFSSIPSCSSSDLRKSKPCSPTNLATFA